MPTAATDTFVTLPPPASASAPADVPAPATPDGVLQPVGCTNFKLRQLTRLVTQHYERRLRSSGMRFTQTPILARLAASPAKMAELSDWLAEFRANAIASASS